MRYKQKGFTLIELMIVIAVISILAALAMAAYQDYLARTQMGEAMVLASGAKSSVAEFASNEGRFPPSNVSAGLALPQSITGRYVSEVSVINGVINAQIRFTGVAPGIEGGTLTLSPDTNIAGAMRWTCRSDVAPKYLPTACRN